MDRVRVEEPEIPEEPEEEPAPALQPSIPAVGEAERPFEYSVQTLSAAELGDGSSLAERLNEASAEGWDLVSVVDVNGGKALVLRRRRRPSKESRVVGFAPPGGR